ncbi:hypothetical protein RhiirC2_850359 [Rhizophagus irregularis]|uniref:Uncharacterized protein n=1 Tax=Rhizophagus irregularis TaxID=588596 RepID=A0A2N1N7R9_9GLOM|nr:hypothetical protein RhiirC2_850359 [Rhizophagus irregularis]
METEEFSFISKDTFNKIIDKFIQNSKSKTSEKQFINRRLYDEIKTVLLDPKESDIAWMEHLFKDENCIDEEQLLENINVEQEDTSLDFEEENDENEDNNSNSIHDKHQNKNRNTKKVKVNKIIYTQER